jgi:TonB-dependent receptor
MANPVRSHIAGVVFSLLIVPSLLAGDIVGRAIDAASRTHLSGVAVHVSGTTLQATTNAEGYFRIANVPAGQVNVIGNHLGFPSTTVPVAVPNQGAVAVELRFGDEVVQLEKFAVEGIREGRARALQQKKTGTTIADIVTSDAFGNLPDRNVADALSRLPGVSLLADSGEGRYVSIRGLNPNLNNVTLNGATLASPGVRNLDGRDSVSGSVVPLDVIGSAQITQLEVVKTLTPDMDASAIGGTVNLRTASAFDRTERLLTGAVTLGYSDLAEKEIYEADVTFADRFGADRDFGVALAASYSNRPFRTEGLQTVWQDTAASGAELVPLSLELLPEDAERERIGVTTNLEYRPKHGGHYYLRAVVNRFEEENDRQEAIIRTNNGVGSKVGPTLVRFTNVRSERRVYRTITEQTQVNVTGGLSREFGAITVEPEVSFSLGREDRPEMKNMQFRNANIAANPGLTIDYSAFRLNLDTGTSTLADPARHVLRLFTENTVDVEEEIWTPKVDFKLAKIDIAGGALALKAGTKYYGSTREVDVGHRIFTGPYTLAQTGAVLPGNSMRGYHTVMEIDYDRALAFLDANRGSLVFDEAASLNNSVANTFRLSQDIYSGFVMGTFERGPLTLIGGIRYEATDATIRAFEYQSQAGAVGNIVPNRATFDFDNLMPGVQLRYAAREDLVFRAAVTNTLRRPEYEFAAPAATLTYNQRIDAQNPQFPYSAALTIGNPQLDPYEALNFDVAGEYYLASGGIVSLSLFHKVVGNPIYQVLETRINTVYNGLGFQELVVSSFQNAEEGKITGAEFAVHLPFTFLPQPFNGFGLDGNFTLIDSEVNISSRPGANLQFFEQPDRNANVSLYYQRGRFSGRVAYAYQSASLRQLGASSSRDFYRADHYQTDVQANFRLSPKLTLFANVQNLTNQPQDTFSGDPTMMRYSRIFGWNARLGVRFEL